MFEKPETTSNVSKGNFTANKPDAYVNAYLPSVKRDGTVGRAKLGSIKLYISKQNDSKLVEYLTADPSRIVTLMADAEFDFQLAEAPVGTGFILPEDAPVTTILEDIANS